MKGTFKPKNPSKYINDPTNIVYRSSWELKVMMQLDINPNIVKWGSEEHIIRYISPIDSKVHRYFPDFFVELINRDGKKQKMLIEVKPAHQTKEPQLSNKLNKSGTVRKTYIREVQTWGINQAKWKAAENYCLDKGWKFAILTEKEIFGK